MPALLSRWMLAGVVAAGLVGVAAFAVGQCLPLRHEVRQCLQAAPATAASGPMLRAARARLLAEACEVDGQELHIAVQEEPPRIVITLAGSEPESLQKSLDDLVNVYLQHQAAEERRGAENQQRYEAAQRSLIHRCADRDQFFAGNDGRTEAEVDQELRHSRELHRQAAVELDGTREQRAQLLIEATAAPLISERWVRILAGADASFREMEADLAVARRAAARLRGAASDADVSPFFEAMAATLQQKIDSQLSSLRSEEAERLARLQGRKREAQLGRLASEIASLEAQERRLGERVQELLKQSVAAREAEQRRVALDREVAQAETDVKERAAQVQVPALRLVPAGDPVVHVAGAERRNWWLAIGPGIGMLASLFCFAGWEARRFVRRRQPAPRAAREGVSAAGGDVNPRVEAATSESPPALTSDHNAPLTKSAAKPLVRPDSLAGREQRSYVAAVDCFYANYSEDRAAAPPDHEMAVETGPADSQLAQAYLSIGLLLERKGRRQEAIAIYRRATALDPHDARTHASLGKALADDGDYPAAIASCRRAVTLEPDLAAAHLNLGVALAASGVAEDAAGHFRRALKIEPDNVRAHANLGKALVDQGRHTEAIAACREALRVDPASLAAQHNLGLALQMAGRHAEAAAAYRRALEIDPRFSPALSNLGVVLQAQGRFADAIAAYRQATTLAPDLAEAHCHLGHALVHEGEFIQGLAALERGHALGSRRPGWAHPSQQWLRHAERLVDLERRLPEVLDGARKPGGDAGHLEYALLCRVKKLHAEAARLFAAAFAADPTLADERSGFRLQAARSAALAAPTRPEAEAARLRELAVGWLNVELDGYAARRSDETTREIRARLCALLQDPELAAIRDLEHVSRLTEVEQEKCRSFWSRLTSLLVEFERCADRFSVVS